MRKRLLSTLLALCMALTLLPGTALAAEVASGSCGDNLTWSLDDKGTLTISGTGTMKEYEWARTPWYNYRNTIKAARIEAGVASIGSSAFYWCSSLTDVTIPDSITSVGESAFQGCSSLTSVTIPDSVTSIGKYAFRECSSLTSVMISKSITSIESSTFWECNSLASVTIPNGVTNIGYNVFYNCSNLTSMTIPDSVTNIGGYAFYNCSNLTSVTIPESVTTIGVQAFAGCNSLTSVTIPKSIFTIEDYVFNGCSRLTDVNYSGTKAQWQSIAVEKYNDPLTVATIHCTDGDIVPESAGDIIASGECGAQGNNLTWTLDNKGTLTIIGTGEMANYQSVSDTNSSKAPWSEYCSSIKEISISNQVTTIGSNTFMNCNNLTSITIPNSVALISGCAFQSCTSLTSIIIPNGVTGIGAYAFENCSSLTTITIPDSVTIIKSFAFHGCTNLASISIPNNVTTIEVGVFDGCSSLKEIRLPVGVNKIEDGAFSYCTNLVNITIPNGVTSIENAAFFSCKNLTGIIIPDTITTIHFGTFSQCANLTSVTIPDTVTAIESCAFEFCNKLSDVYYSGTKAQWQAVMIGQENTPLTTATIHCTDGDIVPDKEPAGNTLTWSLKDGVLTISGTGPMDDYTIFTEARSASHHPAVSREARIMAPWSSRRDEIQKIIIEEGITSIGEFAFNYYTNVTSVEIADSVTSIGFAAFDGCSSLTSVRIPSKVTEIGTYAFGCCHSLKNLPVDDANPSFCSVDGVLYTKDKTKLVQFPAGRTGIYRIPEGTRTVGTWAFDGCWYLQALVVPVSLATVEEIPFFSCERLADIYYPGTENQWKRIENYQEFEDSGANIHFESNGDEWQDRIYDGVKYVPYSCRAEDADFTETPDTPGWEQLRYELVGTLPSGLSLDPKTCVISGVPMASGEFRFSIRRILPHEDGSASSLDLPRILKIQDNSNTAVQQPNDYEITKPVGSEDPKDPNSFLKNSYTDEELVIAGPYQEFMELYLDGGKLTRNEDYTAREGSTVITIRSQTFRKAGEGTHTISAEFRTGGSPTGALKRVAQNYTLTISGSGSGHSSGGGSSSIPNWSKKKQPETKPEVAPGLPFSDVKESDWFYGDLKWAYENGLISGYADGTFKAQRSISQATIVTVLARMAKIDLSKFTGESEAGIAAGKQFTEAAIWAKRSGLLPESGAFTGDETTTRNQMAVMLVKYLDSMGKDTKLPSDLISFSDAEDMSQEGNDAFQVLYQYGIFKGVGGLQMNPSGSTTRAHFMALIHRVYETAMKEN